jgi:hypothetical protein
LIVTTGASGVASAGRLPRSADSEHGLIQPEDTVPRATQRLPPDADAAAIQSALDAAAASTPDGGFGIVTGGYNEYRIDQTLTIPSNAVLADCRLTVADGADITAVESADFQALDGSNTWTAADGVPYNFGLRNVHIDGNRANNAGVSRTTTDGVPIGGVAFYGSLYRVENVVVRDAVGDGYYTECGKGGPTKDWRDLPESSIEDLWVHNCAGVGIRYRGPHDGRIKSAVSAHNGERPIVVQQSNNYSGQGLVINWLHTYSDGDDGAMAQRYEANNIQADKLIGDGDPIELVGNGANVTNIWNLVGSKTTITGHNCVVGQLFARGPAKARGSSKAVVVQNRNTQIGHVDIWGYQKDGLVIDADRVQIGGGMIAGCDGHNVRLGDTGSVRHCSIALQHVNQSTTGGIYYGGGDYNHLSIRSPIGGDSVGWDPNGALPSATDTADIVLVGDGNNTGVSSDSGSFSGQSGQKEYTVDHDLLAEPRVVTITPTSAAAAANHHVETKSGWFTVVYETTTDGSVTFDWRASI